MHLLRIILLSPVPIKSAFLDQILSLQALKTQACERRTKKPASINHNALFGGIVNQPFIAY